MEKDFYSHTKKSYSNIVYSLLITAFFRFQSKVQLQYQFNKLLPENDPTFLAYEKFKANFGIDGMMVDCYR